MGRFFNAVCDFEYYFSNSKVRFPAVMTFERPLGAMIIVVRLSFPKIVNADLPSIHKTYFK